MQKLKLLIIGIFLLLILTGCGISLASDITPPPNLQPQIQQPQQPQTTVSTGTNLMPPDVANGKLIYQQKCIDCHGPSGMGDGAQADKLPILLQLLVISIFPVMQSQVTGLILLQTAILKNSCPGSAAYQTKKNGM